MGFSDSRIKLRTGVTQQPVLRWSLATVMLVVLVAGWRFPWLGFIVPVAMSSGIVGGFRRGRHFCGNYCPRGSFYDTFFQVFSGSGAIPPFVTKKARWWFAAGLMLFIGWRLAQDISQWSHWGIVFWQACLLTTVMGIILGVRYRARAWCAVCPIGTASCSLDGGAVRLQVAADCRGCGACEAVCPFGFAIAREKGGILNEPDCLQCGACIKRCPQNSLSFVSRGRSGSCSAKVALND